MGAEFRHVVLGAMYEARLPATEVWQTQHVQSGRVDDAAIVLQFALAAEDPRRAEQAMIKFARQIAMDASRGTAHQIAALREHGYSDAEIFDIAATSAGRAFFAKILDALGVELDSPFLALDESFRRTLTAGRSTRVHASRCLSRSRFKSAWFPGQTN